jgi:hypothetical protein
MYQKHADVAQLAARTELSFAQHNRSSYALEEEVTLHLDTKNVGPQVGLALLLCDWLAVWLTSKSCCMHTARFVPLLQTEDGSQVHRKQVRLVLLLCSWLEVFSVLHAYSRICSTDRDRRWQPGAQRTGKFGAASVQLDVTTAPVLSVSVWLSHAASYSTSWPTCRTGDGSQLHR